MPKDKLKAGFVVTIDGPAASGKTSVSREVARRLGWRWVSTGAFYRGLAFLVKSHQIDVSDETKIAELIRQAAWEVRLSPERTQVFVNGDDVTEEIYREEVGETASLISQFPSVRSSLLKAQRDCCLGVKGLVAEGRDCGTVVFPDAPIKIYLEASSALRAARRAQEEGLKVEVTAASQALRDKQDSHRQVAPLQIPPSAHRIDTGDLTLEEVVEMVENLIRKDLGLKGVN
ncbi:MAG: (d)CMP kinase [Bdellovibrionales bacterium]|nr:(d)CMP kinase [Bdellovibrionales bacterium]